MALLARKSRAGLTVICHSLSACLPELAELSFSLSCAVAGAHTGAAASKRSTQRNLLLHPHPHHTVQEVINTGPKIPMDLGIRQWRRLGRTPCKGNGDRIQITVHRLCKVRRHYTIEVPSGTLDALRCASVV
jgi:hypothetical protein